MLKISLLMALLLGMSLCAMENGEERGQEELKRLSSVAKKRLVGGVIRGMGRGKDKELAGCMQGGSPEQSSQSSAEQLPLGSTEELSPFVPQGAGCLGIEADQNFKDDVAGGSSNPGTPSSTAATYFPSQR